MKEWGENQVACEVPISKRDRDAVIEECAKVCDELERNGFHYETYDGRDRIVSAEACHCADAIRALKSQPATPDPRDEALRIAREALAEVLEWCVCQDSKHYAPCYKALFAIDKVLG